MKIEIILERGILVSWEQKCERQIIDGILRIFEY